MIGDILKDRGAREQQHQIQDFLKFIGHLCSWFSEFRTLHAMMWKEVGIKIQHYCDYGSEIIPIDTFHFWILIQEMLD